MPGLSVTCPFNIHLANSKLCVNGQTNDIGNSHLIHQKACIPQPVHEMFWRKILISGPYPEQVFLAKAFVLVQ